MAHWRQKPWQANVCCMMTSAACHMKPAWTSPRPSTHLTSPSQHKRWRGGAHPHISSPRTRDSGEDSGAGILFGRAVHKAAVTGMRGMPRLGQLSSWALTAVLATPRCKMQRVLQDTRNIQYVDISNIRAATVDAEFWQEVSALIGLRNNGPQRQRLGFKAAAPADTRHTLPAHFKRSGAVRGFPLGRCARAQRKDEEPSMGKARSKARRIRLLPGTQAC